MLIVPTVFNSYIKIINIDITTVINERRDSGHRSAVSLLAKSGSGDFQTIILSDYRDDLCSCLTT